ncbi:ATP-dependent DNA helicase RecG [Candidatus Saccharibacteria bacterium]|nr:ATP-dependent DNA helicase RecG [Candidatus Saccharibacteria bacterium]
MEKSLNSMGIKNIADLLNHFPRKWETYQSINRIQDIKPGLVSFEAKVENIAMRRSNRHKRLTITEAILSDDTGTVRAVWFNQPYLSQTLLKGKIYRFRGNYEYKNGYVSLAAPSFEKPGTNVNKEDIITIYPETKKITSTIIRKLISQCLDYTNQLEDILPEEISQTHKLIPIDKAIKFLHQPKDFKELELAKRRISFEEMFELILTGLVIKQNIKTSPSVEIKYDPKFAKKFVGLLDFELTSAQKKAAHTILEDVDSDKPMNRMLEGDVGSGKTLVALMAAAMAYNSGYQSVIMVPTEILARQHFIGAEKLLSKLGIKVGLLISALKKSEREELKDKIRSGELDCIIGTHALISKDIEYQKLGLVVVDEQHRFGVNQRSTLKGKAKYMPHVLTMTATPIPRSLALVVYGDLDVSIIDELPPGRKPIQTKLVKEIDRVHVYSLIDSLIAKRQQVYIVCPLISESDKLGVKSVEAEYKTLQKTVFKHRKIGMVHGKLKAEEKSRIMDDFKSGKLDMLLATSVIEVGVDVPNATIMIIEGAERFGLAALHQLRGRVGRGEMQSHCYLFSDSENPATIKRLKALENTNDGFRLAQIDLELRGPGEIYGTMQSGILDLRVADIYDHKLISEVKQAAETFINKHNLLEYAQLAEKINRLKSITTLD